MNHPLLQLVLARLREFYREPQALFWVYGFPLILAFGLFLAFTNRKPEPAKVDVVGESKAEEVAQVLGDAGLDATVQEEDLARHRRRIGKTVLVVVLEPEGSWGYIYDETNPEALSARYQVDATLVRWKSGISEDTGALIPEPGDCYIDWFMPGLIGLNIMGGGLWGIGFVLVDMRVRKLFKRLMATPMKRHHFLLALLLARTILLLPDMALLLLAATWGFGMPMRGNFATLFLVILAGAAAFSGLGLLIASRTEKTETVSGLMNLVMLPMWLLSGVFFSSKRFPDATQPFIQALPLTQLNDALREVMLEGQGLTDIAWRLGILAAFAVVAFAVALKIFRWH